MKKILFTTKAIFLAVSCCLLFSSVIFAEKELEPQKVDPSDIYKEVPLFTDAITLIKKYYVEDVPAKDLIYGALEGMISSLDPFSEFLPPAKYRDVKEETKGEFGGVGLVVARRKGQLTVVSPMEGTPAYEAGILAGDVIREIEGKSTADMGFAEAVDMMRGKPGSKVEMKVSRDESEGWLTFKLKRAVIEIENVKDARIFNETIGYVRVVDFGEKTEKMLKRELRHLKEKGAESLIVDLRNNPGGLLSSAVEVCDLFLEKDELIVYTKDRSGEEQLRFEALRDRKIIFDQTVVLINKGSASGSEILAGALRDHGRAALIGETSFGKASVQTVVPLRDGSAVRLTTAAYYTPSGVTIHEKGIKPDYEIKYENAIIEEAKNGDSSDEDLQKLRDEYLYDEDKKMKLLLADSHIRAAISFIQNGSVSEDTEE